MSGKPWVRRYFILAALIMMAGLVSAVFSISSNDEPRLVPVDVSRQAAKIDLGGALYDFSTPNASWAVQRPSGLADVLRFEVNAGFYAPYDALNKRPYLRTEINADTTHDGEFWLAFDYMLPDADHLLSLGDESTMISQLKAQAYRGHADPGSPMFRIDAKADGLYVRTAGTGTTPTPVPYSGSNIRLKDFPMVSNKWDRFVVRIKTGPGGTGELDFYRNGRKAISLTGLAIGYVDYSYYAKFGIYSDETIKHLVGYAANMEVGPDLSYRLVSPPALPPIGDGMGAGNPPAGTNLVTNGDFETGVLAPAEAQSGKVTVVDQGNGKRARVARDGGAIGRIRITYNGFIVGKTYRATVKRYNGNRSATRFLIAISGTSAAGAIVDDTRSAEGLYAVDFVAAEATYYLFGQTPGGVDGDYNEFDDFEIVEFP